MALTLFKSLHSAFKAKIAKHLVSKEIIKVLKPFHAQELSNAPMNTWPLLRSKQVNEIQAVQAGRLSLTDRILDRRTWATPYLPESIHRIKQPIIKNTPYNLRRFSETPIPRRAINLIKNAIVALPWKVTQMEDVEVTPNIEHRKRILTRNLKRPNNTDSWKTLVEAVVEDILIGGYGAIEQRLTPHFDRPFKLWPVDGSTIRIYPTWAESKPDEPHYAQMTGLKGERDHIDLKDDEIIYIRDNVRTNTPFGLGKLEVSYITVNAFLGAQDMSSKSGANQVFKSWLWWKESLSPGQVSTVERHVRNEEEGQAKISLISGMPKPEVISVEGSTAADLLLEWQEFCIRIIAQGFDLSPFALGLERDVNRSTGDVMATTDFKAAVVPIAKKLEEAITRNLIHRLLQWKDIEFKFVGLEDPDIITKIDIFTKLYALDGINSDEIREDLGKSKDPSGAGRLFNSQKAMQQIEAQAKVQSDAQKSQAAAMPGQPMPGAPGAGGAGSTPTGKPKGITTPPGTVAAPKAPKVPTGAAKSSKAVKAMAAAIGPMEGSIYHALHLMAMSSDELKKARDNKLIPKDSKKLKNAMDKQVPGILQYISEQLQEYFKFLEKEEDALKVEPEETQPADQQEQEEKFKKRELPKEKQKENKESTAQ